MIEYSHVNSEKLISDGCYSYVKMLIHKTGMRIFLIFSYAFSGKCGAVWTVV
jgi:hypothetical protein